MDSDLDARINSMIGEWDEAWRLLLRAESAKGEKFDFSARPSSSGVNLLELDHRIRMLSNASKNIESPSVFKIVSDEFRGDISRVLTSIEKCIGNFKNQFVAIEKNGSLEHIESDALTMHSANGKVNIDLQIVLIHPLNKLIDDIPFPTLASMILIGNDQFTNLEKQVDYYIERTTDVEKLRKKVENDSKFISKSMEDTKKALDEINARYKKIEKLDDDVTNYKTDNERKTNEIDSMFQQVQFIENSSKNLSERVNKYQSEFLNFQNQLENREKLIENGEKRQNTLLINLDEIKDSIDSIKIKAEEMLSGATVAGLASEFGSAKESLNRELQKASHAFYVAIALLSISILPLAHLIFPFFTPSPSEIVETSPGSDVDLLTQAAIRLLLIVPFAWLARFTATRHGRLFRLREHYSYKHSIAASIEGFKKQAPDLDQGIAAAAFLQLLFNPANQMDSAVDDGESEAPNPVLEWIIKKMEAK